MKRYLISTVVILIALAVAWSAFGQDKGTEGRRSREGQKREQVLSKEVIARLKTRRQVIGREAQLKVVEDIEERLAKLKAAIKEGPDRQDFRKLREASPEQQVEFRKEWQKARRKQQQMVNAIQEQLTMLTMPRPSRPDLTVMELRAIYKLAVKENAKQTAERIEKLIAKYQARPVGQPDRPAKSDRPDEQQTGTKQDVEDAVSGESTEANTK